MSLKTHTPPLLSQGKIPENEDFHHERQCYRNPQSLNPGLQVPLSTHLSERSPRSQKYLTAPPSKLLNDPGPLIFQNKPQSSGSLCTSEKPPGRQKGPCSKRQPQNPTYFPETPPRPQSHNFPGLPVSPLTFHLPERPPQSPDVPESAPRPLHPETQPPISTSPFHNSLALLARDFPTSGRGVWDSYQLRLVNSGF